MTARSRRRGLMLALIAWWLLCTPGTGTARAAETASHADASGVVLGGDVTLSGKRGTVLAAGGSIDVTDGTFGDAAMAAGTVHMVGGDIARLAVAGGTVSFDGGRLGDVLAAAGSLKVNALIDGDLHAAGGTIVTTRDAVINGDARLSGGDVVVDGTIKNSLTIRADRIAIAGTIGGTVYLFGKEIAVAPGTHIGGDLIYSAPDALTLPPDVTVGGQVLRRDHREYEQVRQPSILRHVVQALWSIGCAGLLVCGLIIVAVRPALLAPASDAFVHRFGISLLVGAIAACALPVGVIVLATTLIGIPLIFLVLAAAAALAGFGLVIACQWAGDRVRTRFGRPAPAGTTQEIGWGLAGFGVFTVAGVVPLVGGLAQSLVILAGSGAALGTLWQQWLTRPKS